VKWVGVDRTRVPLKVILNITDGGLFSHDHQHEGCRCLPGVSLVLAISYQAGMGRVMVVFANSPFIHLLRRSVRIRSRIHGWAAKHVAGQGNAMVWRSAAAFRLITHSLTLHIYIIPFPPIV
jgi:hypothetical protein